MSDARKNIIVFFEKGIFSYKGNVFKTKEQKSEDQSEEESEEERVKILSNILKMNQRT